MMKLAFCLFKYYPFGGLEQSFLNIAKEAVARGHEVHVFTRAWQGEVPQGIQVHPLKVAGLTNHGKAKRFAAAVGEILKRELFDLVVGFNRMPHLDLYYGADVCFVAQAREKHLGLFRLTSRYRTFAALERAVFGPQADTHVLYISRRAKEEYQRAYGTPESRFHELPAGLNKARIREALAPATRQQVRQELTLRDDDLLLVMVGSDFRRKGVERAVRALASLPEALRAKTHLAVIGRGDHQALAKVAESQRVGQQIHWLGARNDVPRFLAAADLLLHLALSETAGNAIVEGLVAGLPVIVTDACGFSYHVAEAQAGEVVGQGAFDQNELNRTLASALSDSARLTQWGANALRYSDEVDLYSRPQRAVSIMEELAQKT